MAKQTKHELAMNAVVSLGSKLVLLDFERYEEHLYEKPGDIEELVFKKAEPHLKAITDLILEHQLKELNGGSK